MNRFLFLLSIAVIASQARGEDRGEKSAEATVDYRTEIAPILKRNCVACHHSKEAEGGLVLESAKSIRQGGDSGSGAVAGDLDSSLIYTRASGAEEPLMPPEDNAVGAKPLTAAELGLLRRWIEQGAKDGVAAMRESIQWQPIPETVRTVYAIDASPDGRWAAVGRGNRVALVDLHRHAEVARLSDPALSGGAADVDLIQSIAFSPDANRVAAGGFRTVRVWKRRSAEQDRDTPLVRASGRIAVDAAQKTAALVNAVGDLEVWSLSDKSLRHTLTGHTDTVSGLCWAGTNGRLYSCDRSGALLVWDALTGQQLARTVLDVTPESMAAIHSDVALLTGEGQVRLLRFDEETKQLNLRPDFTPKVDDVTAVALVGRPAAELAYATASGKVVLQKIADSAAVRTVDVDSPVSCLAVTGDHSRLVSGHVDGTTQIWNLADAKHLITMKGSPADQLRLASATRNVARQRSAVERMNAKTAELEQRLAKEDESLKKADG